MRFVGVVSVAVILLLASGCSGTRVFLNFSSIDGTPLRDGEVTVRYGYLAGLVRDPSGIVSPKVSTVSQKFSGCKSSVTFRARDEIIWLAIDAHYPGYIPQRFRIDRAAAGALRMYELSELDPHYIPTDLNITADKKSVSVRANLRFP